MDFCLTCGAGRTKDGRTIRPPNHLERSGAGMTHKESCHWVSCTHIPMGLTISHREPTPDVLIAKILTRSCEFHSQIKESVQMSDVYKLFHDSLLEARIWGFYQVVFTGSERAGLYDKGGQFVGRGVCVSKKLCCESF